MTVYNRLQKVAAALVGTTLFVSGSFKLMDPVGTGLIVDEYWKLFHLGFMAPASQTVGLILSLTEALVGVALTTGLFRRTVRIAAAALVGFFTLVTVVLAALNPAMDCGCFGQWLHLSHTASLLKNIVLLALCAVFLFPRIEAPSRRPRYLAAGLIAAAVLFGTVWSLLYLPVVDYTEFAPGVELAAAQEYDGEGAEPAFLYTRGGLTQSFPLSETEQAEQEGWTFVDVDVPVHPSAAHDHIVALSFLDREDRPADTLAARGPVMIVSVHAAARMPEGRWRKTAAFLRSAAEAGYRPLLLVEVPPEELDRLLAALPAEDRETLRTTGYQADRRKLLALNRDNGGATFFSDGMLVRKWGRRALPDKEKLDSLLPESPVELMMSSDTRGRVALHGYFLYALAIALLL